MQYRNIYADALASQNTLNIRGLVRSLSNALDQIAETEQPGTDLCTHPVVTLFLNQLMHLNHSQAINLFLEAVELCEKKATLFEADQAARKTG